MKQPITIVGLGQIGSMLAYRLIRKGKELEL